jgi:hypothetical protein
MRKSARQTRVQVASLKLWEASIVVENRLKKQIHLPNSLMNSLHPIT